jgi:hypothetical protein
MAENNIRTNLNRLSGGVGFAIGKVCPTES